jgi:hypothetical protein
VRFYAKARSIEIQSFFTAFHGDILKSGCEKRISPYVAA